MTARINQYVYYPGLASCSFQGCAKSLNHSEALRTTLVYSIIMAFGGGMIRDILILGIHPWILTLSALPDLILVLVANRIYLKMRNKNFMSQNTLDAMITITDALGLASFVQLGFDKALKLKEGSSILAFLSGYITGVGGGVILSCLTPHLLLTAHTLFYHSVTIIATLLYAATDSFLATASFTTITIFFADVYTCPLPQFLIPRIHYFVNYLQLHRITYTVKQQLSYQRQKYKIFLQRRVKYYFFSRLKFC